MDERVFPIHHLHNLTNTQDRLWMSGPVHHLCCMSICGRGVDGVNAMYTHYAEKKFEKKKFFFLILNPPIIRFTPLFAVHIVHISRTIVDNYL